LVAPAVAVPAVAVAAEARAGPAGAAFAVAAEGLIHHLAVQAGGSMGAAFAASLINPNNPSSRRPAPSPRSSSEVPARRVPVVPGRRLDTVDDAVRSSAQRLRSPPGELRSKPLRRKRAIFEEEELETGDSSEEPEEDGSRRESQIDLVSPVAAVAARQEQRQAPRHSGAQAGSWDFVRRAGAPTPPSSPAPAPPRGHGTPGNNVAAPRGSATRSFGTEYSPEEAVASSADGSAAQAAWAQQQAAAEAPSPQVQNRRA
jgi:hypothetical protein